MQLEVCVSCWNYSRLLCYHLSGFVLYPPRHNAVIVTVCYCPEDIETVAVLEFFERLTVPFTSWNWKPFDRRQLMRRAISRNEVAQQTAADWLLFGDVDYLFSGEGVIDDIASHLRELPIDRLAFPSNVMMSSSHEAGDAEIDRVNGPDIYAIDPDRYTNERLPRAIGGAQWVPGEVARRIGYLPRDKRFQRPATRWMRTYEDKIFRHRCGLTPAPLSVSGVYRIRHSRRGRFDVGCKL